MVTYYIVTNFFVANTPSTAWAIIGESIRDGSLATWLVRPVSHYGIFLGRVLGSWIPFWVLGLGGIACLAGILHRYFVLQTDPVRILATLIFWLGGVVLGFYLGISLKPSRFLDRTDQRPFGPCRSGGNFSLRRPPAPGSFAPQRTVASLALSVHRMVSSTGLLRPRGHERYPFGIRQTFGLVFRVVRLDEIPLEAGLGALPRPWRMRTAGIYG